MIADKTPYMFAPFSGVGIELWTMTSGIFFDNILITRDPDQAAEYAAKTWQVTHDLEKAKKDAASESSDPLKMVTDLLDTVSPMRFQTSCQHRTIFGVHGAVASTNDRALFLVEQPQTHST